MTAPASPPLAELIAELRRDVEENGDAVVGLWDGRIVMRLLVAAERAEGLASALEEMEWSSVVDFCACCPVCGGSRDCGHNGGCPLHRALAAYRGSAP